MASFILLRFFGRTAFLLGEFSEEGFWFYFPVAFLAKTPLPTLILVLLSTVGLLTRRNDYKRRRFIYLGSGVGLFFHRGFARMNIGIRTSFPSIPSYSYSRERVPPCSGTAALHGREVVLY